MTKTTKTTKPTAKAAKVAAKVAKPTSPLAAQKERDAAKLSAVFAKPAKAKAAKVEKVEKVAAAPAVETKAKAKLTPVAPKALSCGVCGRGFREHSSDSVCPECFEIAGLDNSCNDNGRKLTEAEATEVGALVAKAVRKGGDEKAIKKQNGYINWKDVVVPETDADRAACVSKSWLDKAVAKARTTRIGVKVGKDEYGSLMKAIVALKLDPTNMQAARIALKREGKVEFRGVKFVVVKQ